MLVVIWEVIQRTGVQYPATPPYFEFLSKFFIFWYLSKFIGCMMYSKNMDIEIRDTDSAVRDGLQSGGTFMIPRQNNDAAFGAAYDIVRDGHWVGLIETDDDPISGRYSAYVTEEKKAGNETFAQIEGRAAAAQWVLNQCLVRDR